MIVTIYYGCLVALSFINNSMRYLNAEKLKCNYWVIRHTSLSLQALIENRKQSCFQMFAIFFIFQFCRQIVSICEKARFQRDTLTAFSAAFRVRAEFVSVKVD